MDLLTPQIGWVAWMIITAFVCGIAFSALLILIPNKTLNKASKTKWAFIILLAPVVGAILFFSLAGAFAKKKSF